MGSDQDAIKTPNGRPPKYVGPAYFYPFTFAHSPEWMLYGIGAIMAVISGVGYPFLDLLYGIWTTAVVEGSNTSGLRATTNKVAGFCAGIGILQFVVSSIFVCCFSIASSRLTDRLRRAYLNSVVHQDAEFFENLGPGEVGTRMVKDIGIIRTAVGEKLSIVIWSLATLVTAIIMAFTRAPKLAGVVFSIVPFAFILFTIIGQLSSKAEAKLLVVDGQAGTLLEQILSSVRVVQSFAAETFLSRKYDVYLRQLQKLGKWRSIVRGLELGAANCVISLIYSLTFWYGSRLVVSENLAVGLMFTIFWNMFNALFAIVGILPHILAIQDSAAISARLLKDIERVPAIDVCNTEGARLWSKDGEKVEKIHIGIELKNVTFVYPSRPDHRSLDGISLVIEGGKVTALVGASGSGKSTIASLLLRYYDPVHETGGQVLLSSHDLRTLNLSWLRSQISIVSQDPQLFTASIFDNVAYGLTGTPYELPSDPSSPDYQAKLENVQLRVEQALKQAQAWEFVCDLPEGMETRVSGARTGVLSGGQRQRIAAARALIRKPKILVLDEGTSALDSETEQRLMAAIHLEQAETGMTTILIAHRLSSIQNADTIVTMSNGRVVEQGTYEELMSLGQIFAGLVRHQLSVASPAAEPTTSGEHPPMLAQTRSPSKHAKSQSDSDISGLDQTVLESLERGDLDESRPGSITARFGRLLWRHRTWMLGGFIAGLCIGASFPIGAWLVGLVVKTFAIVGNDDRLLREARRWSFWYLILAIVDVCLSFITGYFLSAGADRIDRRLRLVGLSSLLKQEIGYFDREENASGALTAAVSTHANNVSSAIGLVWQQLITATANFLGALILGLVLSWKLSLVGYIPVPFIIAAAYYNIMFMERHERQVLKPLEEASAFASENVDSIRTVAALGRELSVMEQFDRAAVKNAPKRRYLAIGAVGFGIGVGSTLVISAIVMWWGTALYTRGRISIENLYSCFEAVMIAGFSASRIFTFVPDLARMVSGFRTVCGWEDRCPKVADFNSAKESTCTVKSLENVEGELVFKSCTLKYASRPKPAIANMSFTIKPGQTVAFCGPSGGGKTSIISMISRFYDPSTGTIFLDGRDIRSIPLDDYRSHIALVSQDAVLYEGTFRENITLGQNIPQEQLEHACRDASILEFIESLPEGFETSVGLKGSQMSGGQRQRICIARALLRNPKILLLDEATSALDAESEKSVKEALEKVSRGRTTISVAHRLSTIQHADVIHVVEDGRIVESGSHAELLAFNGRYVDLVRSQL